MKFKDVPKFTSQGNYRVNTAWDHLEATLDRYIREGLDLNPDFQRGHVWSEDQQRAYVEFILSGGGTSNEIRFNCVGWMKDYKGPFVIVDGKQRLEAVRKFLRNELRAFGHLYQEFEDRMPHHAEFIFVVNNLSTRREVLNWYLEINSGGVVHTPEELDKVKRLLETENDHH